MSPEPSPPDPQHESLLAFLLLHPPTPLSEVTSSASALPPELPPDSGRRLQPETIALYAQAFHELAGGTAPITASLLARHLGFRPSNIGRTVRILERYGYIRICGMAPGLGPRPAMIWEWTGPRAPV